MREKRQRNGVDDGGATLACDRADSRPGATNPRRIAAASDGNQHIPRSANTALEGEITRLTDAVAQLGLSQTLKARLMSAEAEYESLTARVESRPPPLPSTEGIGAKIRDVAMRLDTALAQDVAAARAILAGTLGPVVIEERDGAAWAQMEVGPHCCSQLGPTLILLRVAGAFKRTRLQVK